MMKGLKDSIFGTDIYTSIKGSHFGAPLQEWQTITACNVLMNRVDILTRLVHQLKSEIIDLKDSRI